ncbi:MAG: hypothetical protein GEV11_18120 [Streptosporangiales bacterium]|nr:hypothetical protein [Streptosporangiales bacterium]
MGPGGAAGASADGLRSTRWGDDAARPPWPYRAERLAVYVSPESDPPATTRDWPGTPLTEEQLSGGPCPTLERDEARAVGTAVAPIRADTVCRQDGTAFRAYFRPLLPHETDCRTATRA